MAGSAQARTPSKQLECVVRVGTQERHFLVTGDRKDNGIDMASPQPFTVMPLVWSRAFGGQDVAENPIGKGVEKEDGVVSLPNVTEKVAGALLEKTPACPGPMPSPYRNFSSLGTFDTAWLKKNWPGPPSDFNWSFFNLAQEAQRRENPFIGNESITLTNLHPDHEVLQSALPGLRVRLFLNLGNEDTPLWQEVETVADTLWLFPNQAIGMQLWHAACPTSDEMSSEICQVAALYEPCDGPRKTLPELFSDLEAAQAEDADDAEDVSEKPQIIEETAGEVPEGKTADSAMAAMTMPEFEAPEVPQPDITLPDDPVAMLDVVMKNARQDLPELLDELNPELVKMGLEPLTVEQVLAQMDKQHKAMTQVLLTPQSTEEAILQQVGISPKQFDDILKATSLEPPVRSSFLTNEAYETALQAYGDEFAALTNASPKIREQLISQIRLVNDLQTNPDAADALFPKAPSFEETLEKLGFNADMAKFDAAFDSLESLPPGESSLMTFMHEFGVALGIDPKLATDQLRKQLGSMRHVAYNMPEIQSRVEKLFENFPEEQPLLPVLKQNIQDAKYGTSFDLKSLALEAGISNEELLEGIIAVDPLPISPLVPPPETALVEEHLAQEDLTEDLTEDLNPSKDEDIEEAPSEEIPKDEPVLDYSGHNLAGMNFAGHVLAFARFDDANLNQADFSGANLEGASFTNADLSNANLSGANLENADFTKAKLEGTNFSTGNADGATFANVVLDKTIFFKTHLCGASFTGCSAKGTDFSGCTLERASLTESILDGARFADAKLGRVDFTSCTLVHADFTRTDMESARMYDNFLDHCVFFKARAQESSWLRCRGESQNLREAELAKATFDDCSLVRSDLGAVGARECRFHSCDLHGADLRFADFLNGALRDCKLSGADLSGASLFACDLLYAAFNEETKFEGANIERTCLALGEL